jgi:asparagine synthetase B (glutamine-hydrolysing)
VTQPAAALTALERSAGIAIDTTQVLGEWPDRAHDTARHALEAAVQRALLRAPCVVSFSGGRDSSAVLALATAVARRENLPLPIPFTFRFPNVPSTEESEWQERVISYLQLEHWERTDITDEFDLLGDTSRYCLTTHGLTWPPNAYLHVPIFQAARHGSVLTGLDGDGLLGDWRWLHAQSVLHGRLPRRVRDISAVGLALAPTTARRVVQRRRPMAVPDWLTPAATRAFTAALVDRAAGEPRRWDKRLQWYAKSRALYLAVTNLDVIALSDDVTVVHPLFDRTFLAVLAAEGGPAGIGNRTEAMRHLFGDLLPAEIIERRSKAEFGRAFWGEQAQDFARSWDGSGIDHDLVDGERLQAAWSEPSPMFHSYTPLLAAWLAANTSGGHAK